MLNVLALQQIVAQQSKDNGSSYSREPISSLFSIECCN